MTVLVYDHPLSPYAQKVKIALDEKRVPYEARLPEGIGSGATGSDFAAANPRGEVPALVDGETSVFDSTIILDYIEERWPEPALLPASAVARARVRMIEDVMDTHYEANTWAMGEVRAFGRATGDLAARLEREAGTELARWHRWLDARLGDGQWFNGQAFGWGDLCVVPFVNGAARMGFAPDPDSALSCWLARANERPSVAISAEAAAKIALAGAGGGDGAPGLALLRQLVDQGLFKREYRDHRLEWMIRHGAIGIVLHGLEKSNIRFTEPFPA